MFYRHPPLTQLKSHVIPSKTKLVFDTLIRFHSLLANINVLNVLFYYATRIN